MLENEQADVNLTDKAKLREFLVEEIQEIERHKWIESEKAGHDLGHDAIMEWVLKYAKQYRESYIKRKKLELLNTQSISN